MTYPNNFEEKIGFSAIRSLLQSYCLSPLGMAEVEAMQLSSDETIVSEAHAQTNEYRLLLEQMPDFLLHHVFDVRECVRKARISNAHLEVHDFFDLRRSLFTIHQVVSILHPDAPENRVGEALYSLADGIATHPQLVQRIDQIIDSYGQLRDTASPELARIRRELAQSSGAVSRVLHRILTTFQAEGMVEKDVTPTVRDGRLVLPITPSLKRKVNGIVHDESATGRTLFVEPAEVVEANNKIRALESEERQEVLRILTKLTQHVRPHVHEILDALHFLGQLDFIQAKVHFAEVFRAISPQVSAEPCVDWIAARHPLLEERLQRHGAKIVPLDITLSAEKRILIISGPNAGGKSVCLKTVGLLQYMLQCGVPIPVSERSKCGIFTDLMIDIGDEQSIENDLSTYSSHLYNMKNMMRQACPTSLILIDELGTGTEPQIGSAIAESILNQFYRKGAWAVITTHYQNLKHFADHHPEVANGAMLYDRHEMRALFQLAIGRPGSSFAIEIARKIGLPENVIAEASEIVGSDYIQSDKYLQDIVRDKRYWEGKRQTIRQQEKDAEQVIAQYEQAKSDLQRQRKQILAQAKAEAEQLLQEGNRRIENAIKAIKEAQAEKETTRKIREELQQFTQTVKKEPVKEQGLLTQDEFEKKIEQLKQRRQRKEKRSQEKAQREQQIAEKLRTAVSTSSEIAPRALMVGDAVRIKGTTTVGLLERIDGAKGVVIFGGMRSTVALQRLERVKDGVQTAPIAAATQHLSHATRATIDQHKQQFHQDLDLRGMHGDAALNAVQHFIDDAILLGMPRVRILHGKGNGILRTLIRQYLATVPNVEHYADEQVQFGGAGITVVDL